MDIETFKVFGAATLVLPAIFYIGLGRILAVPPHSRVVSVTVAALAIMGIWGTLSGKFSELLMMAFVVPAYQHLIFRALHAVFMRRFRRVPETAAFNFSSGIFPDRLFNVAFMLLSVLLPLFTVAYFLRP